jgi:hypothetical protein
MPPRYVAEHIKGSARYILPVSYSREIGRIMVRWAYLEHYVQDMIWQMLGLNKPAGRIAVREPRLTDRLEMLRELIELREGTWDDTLFTSILSQARILLAKRDLLAHGIWHFLEHANEWHVQRARGSWPKNLRELVAKSKRVVPESVHIELETLRSATKDLDELISDLKKLGNSAYGGPPPLHEKSD